MPFSLSSAARAACLAGAAVCGLSALPAQAQYLHPFAPHPYAPPVVRPPGFIEPMPYPMAPPHRMRRHEGMGPGQIAHVLRARHGFLEIGRLERDGPVYLVQGVDRRGIPVSVVIDAIDGEILSRDRLGRAPLPPQPVPAPGARGEAKVVTLPPQRPSGLGAPPAAPPAEASSSTIAKAPQPALPPAPSGVYPPPADPRLAEKLGAR